MTRTRINTAAFVVLLASACATGPRPARAAADPLPGNVVRAAALSRPLRVMTFNIQSARAGLDAVAALIRAQDADVVALNEVDRGTTRAHGLNQAEELARRAGYDHFVFFRATSLFGGDYGVALLSRYEILDRAQFRLPTPRGAEPRTVGRVVLAIDGRPFSVYVTHLSNAPARSAVRTLQARFIARLMHGDPFPRMLMGDFNDEAESPALLLLKRRFADAFALAGEGSPSTYPLPFPLADLRLDYVLASRELQPRRAFVVRQLASDHYPVVVDFGLPPAPRTVVATGGGASTPAAARATP
ncbi:MAG: endonuclease/exonuclease/phosphatase family protein [Myxococcaceae bacterium]|nr:endonuclease/exonuclease/phosphatase family protein [Myxococcaceae bacterium]